jgi:hypothetical protein
MAILVVLGLWPGPLVTALERIAGTLLESRHDAVPPSLTHGDPAP